MSPWLIATTNISLLKKVSRSAMFLDYQACLRILKTSFPNVNIDSCCQAQIKLGQSIYQTLNRENDPCRPGSVTHCKEKCRWPTTRFSKKPNWDHGEHGVFVMIGKRTIIGGDFHEVENDHGERQHHLQAALCMWVDWSYHHDLGPMESMPIRACCREEIFSKTDRFW